MEYQKLVDFYHGQYQPQNMRELIDILTDVSQRQVHGDRDNDVWEDDVLIRDNSDLKKAQIRRGDLNCHCRYVSQTMVELFKDVGIEARMTEWTSRTGITGDARHNTFETYFDGQYVHADVDIAVIFMLNGGYFSSMDLKIGFDEGTIDPTVIHRLFEGKVLDENYHLTKHIRRVYQDNDFLFEWHRRMADSLMIGVDICLGNTPEDDIEFIRRNIIDHKRKKVKFLTLEEFRKKYYSQC